MQSGTINFDRLFDADEEYRSGKCPWTFFAYPTSTAREHGLPSDIEACGFLAKIQGLGIEVAIWVNGTPNTTYFACRKSDAKRLNDAIEQLETAGAIEQDFCAKRCERLFAKDARWRKTPLLRETIRHYWVVSLAALIGIGMAIGYVLLLDPADHIERDIPWDCCVLFFTGAYTFGQLIYYANGKIESLELLSRESEWHSNLLHVASGLFCGWDLPKFANINQLSLGRILFVGWGILMLSISIARITLGRQPRI